MAKPLDIIILAAGRGSRLRAETPKPLLPLAGEPLLAHVLSAAAALRPRRIVIVVSADSQAVQETAREKFAKVEFAVQKTPRGTGDAARCGAAVLNDNGTALILCADAPLLEKSVLRKLANAAAKTPALLTFIAKNPRGYGRVLRENKHITAVVEDKDASAKQKQIDEVFAGALAAPCNWLKRAVRRLRANNKAGELYLTELAELANRDKLPAAAITAEETEATGINTLQDLAIAEAYLRQRRAAALMTQGVGIVDPARIDLRGHVRAGRGTMLDVNVVLENTTLARNVAVGAHCVITDCAIGEGARILPFCHLEGAKIGAECVIGPYARVRAPTTIGKGARIGNFVELKNANIGAGTKAGHLSYLGDVNTGEHANIGAGVITCNYDGRKKHKTDIGAEAFIGSDSQLIAPVRVGQGAYIAAGTTLTKDAPPGELTWSRTLQTSRRRRK